MPLSIFVSKYQYKGIMTKFNSLIFIILSLFVISCNDDKVIDDTIGRDPHTASSGVETSDSLQVNMFSAVLSGKLVIPEQIGDDFSFGFELSSQQDFAPDSTFILYSDTYDDSGTFSYSIDGTNKISEKQTVLEPGKTYYVRSFMINSSSRSFGITQSFSTIPLEISIADFNNGKQEITFNTNYSTKGLNNITDLSLNLSFGLNDTSSLNDSIFPIDSLDSNNNFSINIFNLPYDTLFFKPLISLISSSITDIPFIGNTISFVHVFPQYVDLGLSVDWATHNVGAEKPEDYGDYFAWGATEPLYELGHATEDPQCHWKPGKSDGYCFINTPYQTSNSNSESRLSWLKYTGSNVYYRDPSALEADLQKTILDPMDDAAFVNWGDEWRMPSIAEIDELVYNCSWTWYDSNNSEFNGIAGFKVSGKKPGYSNNYIFIPTSGYRYFTDLIRVGFVGAFWSNSLNKNASPDICIAFYCDDPSFLLYGASHYNVGRYVGFPIRPVHSSSKPVENITLNHSALELEPGNSICLSATVFPSDAKDNFVSYVSSNDQVASIDQSGNLISISPGYCIITATCGPCYSKCLVSVISDVNENSYVDLGLSVKWATHNLGSKSPEDPGYYIAWGEVEPKDSYTWSNYKYCNGNNSSLTKYCHTYSFGHKGYTDKKHILDLSDDAAYVNWGDNWRLPTLDEIDELRDPKKCSWEWFFNGYKITSKIPGFEGNWIYLPATGYANGSSICELGTEGQYLISRLNFDYPNCTETLEFTNSIYQRFVMSRSRGIQVRPVFSPVEKLILSNSSLDLAEGCSHILSTIAFPSESEFGDEIWSSSNPSVATVDETGTIHAISPGTCTITVSHDLLVSECAVNVFDRNDVFKPVDLGLSVKWATCNIGATNPEEYGDYFAWGETEPYYQPGYAQDVINPHWKFQNIYGYDIRSYKYSEKTYPNSYTKYCNNRNYNYYDSKTVLDPDDDAAHVNWGGEWRMPTITEFNELLNTNNCTHVWTSINGIIGCKFISKISGFVGNSIFLPASGSRNVYDLYDVGSVCRYWSSTLYNNGPTYAYYLDLFSIAPQFVDYHMVNGSRFRGFPVRPVCD